MPRIHDRTPLYWAIHVRRQIAFVNDMISSENITTMDEGSFTPLHLAVTLGYWELVPVLMDRGADVNILVNALHYTGLFNLLQLLTYPRI
jgi:ankyrin repeat protein